MAGNQAGRVGSRLGQLPELQGQEQGGSAGERAGPRAMPAGDEWEKFQVPTDGRQERQKPVHRQVKTALD